MNIPRLVECCGAPSKNECCRPPCPCNIEEYSKREIEDAKRTERRQSSSISEYARWESGL